MGMSAILVMWQNHLNKLSFPHPLMPPHEIWLWLACCFWGKDVWKWWVTDGPMEACLYYKLTHEPEGSGKLEMWSKWKNTYNVRFHVVASCIFGWLYCAENSIHVLSNDLRVTSMNQNQHECRLQSRYLSYSVYLHSHLQNPWIQWTFVHGQCLPTRIHGQCPLSPWTMSSESMDNVHWVHFQWVYGHCPLSPWTMFTESMDLPLCVFPTLYLVKNYSNATKPSSSQCMSFIFYDILWMHMSINTERHIVFGSSA